MTYRVEITPIAEAQIEQAYCWYRERNPDFADRWFRSLLNTIVTLQEYPQKSAVTNKEFRIMPDPKLANDNIRDEYDREVQIRTVEVTAIVGSDGKITIQLPPDIPPGEYPITLLIQQNL